MRVPALLVLYRRIEYLEDFQLFTMEQVATSCTNLALCYGDLL